MFTERRIRTKYIRSENNTPRVFAKRFSPKFSREKVRGYLFFRFFFSLYDINATYDRFYIMLAKYEIRSTHRFVYNTD